MEEGDTCILCHGTRFSVIHRKDGWLYRRCAGCGLVSLINSFSASDMVAHYEDYLPTDADSIGAWHRMMMPVIEEVVQTIVSKKGKERGRVLDVGCGYGFFLAEMKARGWQVEGIELSAQGRHYAHNTGDIEVHSDPLEDLLLPENSFDVVTLFYVIEHVIDPVAVLQAAWKILKPGGLLLLRWPHSTPIVTILGPLSRYFDLYHTPYHLYDFSPETMRRLLAMTGFTGIETSIGGYTRPARWLDRWSAAAFGTLGGLLYTLSRGHILLPGISKMTTAVRPPRDSREERAPHMQHRRGPSRHQSSCAPMKHDD